MLSHTRCNVKIFKYLIQIYYQINECISSSRCISKNIAIAVRWKRRINTFSYLYHLYGNKYSSTHHLLSLLTVHTLSKTWYHSFDVTFSLKKIRKISIANISVTVFVKTNARLASTILVSIMI